MTSPVGPPSPPGPLPGWYPDPGGVAAWRWWDGQAWTAHTSPPSHPLRTSPRHLVESEKKFEPWCSAAIIAYVLAAIAGDAVGLAGHGRWATNAREQRQYWNDLFHGVRAPPVTLPVDQRVWGLVVGAIGIAVIVVVLLWQFRAAVAARGLNYPARRSPGWGVGSWFVPVVQCWMPYQAIRDLLPPGHALRRWVLVLWLLLVSWNVLALAAFPVALYAWSWQWWLIPVRSAAVVAGGMIAIVVVRTIGRQHVHDAARQDSVVGTLE